MTVKDSAVEIPNSFKDTAIGPIPLEWEVVRLGRVASLNMGQSPPSSTYNTNGDGLPFLQGKAEFGPTYPTPIKWCSEPQRIADQGSILISVRAPVGDVNVAKDKYCIGRGLAAISGNELLDNGFLFHLLTFAKRRLEERGTGSTFKSINKGVLQDFPIPLPPLPEQRCIAHVLSTAQRAIAAQEDVIAAAKETKRSLMQRLFTYGPGAEPARTKETEIGEIPAHWEVVRVDEVFEIKLGKMLSKAARKGVSPCPYLRNANVQWGHIDLDDVKEMDFTPDEMEVFQLKRDDILVCEGGEIGRTAIWEDQLPECYYQKALHRLRPKEPNMLPRFFLHYMRLIFLTRKIPVVEGARSTIAHLPVAKLKMVPLVLPPVGEQGQVVDQLATMDRKITAEVQRKVALQALFQSMLQQLMTGQVRVAECGKAQAQRMQGFSFGKES
jgi:type I restriction enzyme S subunit